MAKTEYLLDQQVKLVLAALMPSNGLACEVSLHTGLRISDVLSLKTEQIKPRFWVKESKTGKSKMVGLPDDLRQRLLAQAGSVYVFENRLNPNKHRTRQAVWADVKRVQKAFRFGQNVGPHSFRKDYAVRLMEKYGDIEKVRRALNHDRETTTAIYAMADVLLRRDYARKYNGKYKRWLRAQKA